MRSDATHRISESARLLSGELHPRTSSRLERDRVDGMPPHSVEVGHSSRDPANRGVATPATHYRLTAMSCSRGALVPRPNPTYAVHFTHVSHLESIVAQGLLADSHAQGAGLKVEVGNTGIKDQRRRREVPVAPRGVVADYVPFYFAPRSPMMFAIECGNVPTYTAGCDELVYLVSTVDLLCALGQPVTFTDRNAALNVARYSTAPEDLDDLVDWPLMKAAYWRNTSDDPERRERRMAECLVHRRVPWAAFTGVVARKQTCAAVAHATLDSLGASIPVSVRPNWYF